MSINVKPNHPLAELLARKLFGIEGVPQKEQTKMVRAAIKAAVLFYKKIANEQGSYICARCGFKSKECKYFLYDFASCNDYCINCLWRLIPTRMGTHDVSDFYKDEDSEAKK